MSHKAGADFFKTKRDWSLRKDLILQDYLVPYLPKMASQGRPVLVVDGFAGPGRFDDGQPGSPLIICEAVRARRANSAAGVFKALLVERDPELFGRLKDNTSQFRDFLTVRNDSFGEVLPDIEKAVSENNVFLYLDPFTVTGLAWNSLDRIFQHVNHKQSVECLINFNVFALARVACVALGKKFKDISDEEGMVGESGSTIATVNESLGGEWWQEPFRAAKEFSAACEILTRGYVDKLRGRFAEVCWHEIKERHAHSIAKYILVFGSRHPAALELMNDAMAKSLQHLAQIEAPTEALLFENRPKTLVPDSSELDASLLTAGKSEQPRGALILSIIRAHFGKYPRSLIRSQIDVLLKQRKLQCRSGKKRINDDEMIRATC
jgi:three-Cys-motif partner protein